MIDKWLAALAVVNLFMPVQICVSSLQPHVILPAARNAHQTVLILRHSMASNVKEESLNHMNSLQKSHVQFAGRLAKEQQEQLRNEQPCKAIGWSSIDLRSLTLNLEDRGWLGVWIRVRERAAERPFTEDRVRHALEV